MSRTDPIGIVDCNNFYISCERVFQPSLRGRPVVVLSNNDGCVIARSNEAKDLDIRVGDPWHLNKDRYRDQDVIVRSSNYALYGDMSARVMRVLSDFTPQVEIYSIDEAFLGLGGFEQLEAHARDLRRTVLKWTGIPVSIGIAPTKTLAKVANRFAKNSPTSAGVHLLMDEAEQRATLASIDLTDIWGIGTRSARRLSALGISTALDLRDADPRFLRTRFSVVMERTSRELRGIPCIDLEEDDPDRKSIISSRSFGRPVECEEEMREALCVYTARAAEKARRQHLAVSALAVFVATNRHRQDDRQYTHSRSIELPVATADTGCLTRAAMRLHEAIWKPGFRYKKAGVILLGLVPAAKVQSGLFDQPDDTRSLSRMAAIDALNARYGRGTIAYGTSGEAQQWRLRCAFVSPRYTTRWDELLRV